MHVLALVRDLFFRARLEAAARAASADLSYAASLDRACEQVAKTAPSLVIVDLGDGAFDVRAVTGLIREQAAAARIVGFGPHAEIGKLDAARAAGFDDVLSREEFTTRLPKLLGGSLRK